MCDGGTMVKGSGKSGGDCRHPDGPYLVLREHVNDIDRRFRNVRTSNVVRH